MPRNNKPIVIGAAVLGALAIGLTLMMLLGRVGGGAPAAATGTGDPAAQAAAARTTRLVAARDIPPRTVITPDMVREEETDEAADPAVLKTAGELQAGRITTRPILRGEPIVSSAMINTIARVVPANFAVPTGLRAVAIWVDPRQTAAGLVDVGDRVDVIASQKLTATKQATESFDQVIVGATEYTTGRTIAQDLEVLAVDSSIERAAVPTPAPAGAQPGAPGAAAPPPPPPPAPAGQVIRWRVILAAPPVVAAALVAANEAGNLHVTIRNPNSRERFPIPETRQYPTRFVNVPKRQGASGSGGAGSPSRGGGGSNAGERVINNPFVGPITLPSPTTPGGSGGAGFSAPPPATAVGSVPPAAAGSEVTVIRGTEKTRVIVPPR
ncbi:MAG TPA: Flp pilus assembly protein CpaB [Abditibacteriaceae bacterium]|jgi:Flp pilus assembly protein CpaB